MKRKRSFLRIVGWVAIAVIAIVALTAATLFWPVNPAPLASHPNPVPDYNTAVQHIAAIQAGEASFNPDCKTTLLTHGQKANQVVILVHGYTTCPNQYRALAPALFDQGYNVLLVPLPYHGFAERMSADHANLTASELTAYADKVIDIGQGLGEKVSMLGISLGGVTTAWAAQHRSDLDKAVVVSPIFGFQALPRALMIPYMRVYQALPNSFTWWDPVKQDQGGYTYSYPRYATRALAQGLLLGQAVAADARKDPIAAGSLVVVTNANDPSVDNVLTGQTALEWQKHAAPRVKTYEFPADLKLGHDLLDPSDPDANPPLVYGKLIEFLKQD